MKQLWSPQELEMYWSLTPEQVIFCRKSARSKNLLPFALQFKFLENEGRFPRQRNEFAMPVIRFVAEQLEVHRDTLLDYEFDSRSCERHRRTIRDWLRFRPSGAEDLAALKDYLLNEFPLSPLSRDELREDSLEWFRQRRIEPPTIEQLDRLIASSLSSQEKRLFEQVAASITEASKIELDRLLKGSTPLLAKLKADPGRPGMAVIKSEVEKLQIIESLSLPASSLSQLPTKALQSYRQRTASEPASALRERVPDSRHARLAIYCWVRRSEIIDGIVELLIQMIHGIGRRAEKRVVAEIIRDVRKVRGKTSLLFSIAEAALGNLDGRVRDVVLPVADEATLNDLVQEGKSVGPGYRRQIHTVVRASYKGHYRAMVPLILDALEFRSNNSHHRPVLDAVEVIRQHSGSRERFYSVSDVPVDGVIRKNMRSILIDRGPAGIQRIDRIGYEIAVLEALRAKLRCKEIWVVGANRYRNPDDDLPQDFESRREGYYQRLGLPLRYDDFAGTLRRQMEDALADLNATIVENPMVRIQGGGRYPISVSPLVAQPEPENIAALKNEIQARWPNTEMIDVLKEADLRLGFTRCFAGLADYQKVPIDEMQRRLLLVLYGLGTNTGLKRVSSERSGVTYKELLYTRRRYLDKASLRDAIATVANGIFAARIPEIWGEGTTACASDSKKFGAWDQNLMTEWHIRYGGRGVMIYWHVEKKSVCVYSQANSES